MDVARMEACTKSPSRRRRSWLFNSRVLLLRGVEYLSFARNPYHVNRLSHASCLSLANLRSWARGGYAHRSTAISRPVLIWFQPRFGTIGLRLFPPLLDEEESAMNLDRESGRDPLVLRHVAPAFSLSWPAFPFFAGPGDSLSLQPQDTCAQICESQSRKLVGITSTSSL